MRLSIVTAVADAAVRPHASSGSRQARQLAQHGMVERDGGRGSGRRGGMATYGTGEQVTARDSQRRVCSCREGRCGGRLFTALAVAFAVVNAVCAVIAVQVTLTVPSFRAQPIGLVVRISGAFALVCILAVGAALTKGRRRSVLWWLAVGISAADQLDELRLGYGYRPRDLDLYIGIVVLLTFVAASIQDIRGAAGERGPS